jgi:hypothetical protein
VTAPLNTWSEVPGGGNTDVAVSAVAPTNEDVYVVGKGIDDKGIYLNHYDHNADSWSGWTEVPGGGQTDAPIAVAGPAYNRDGAYVLHVFAKGLDDHIYYNPVQL